MKTVGGFATAFAAAFAAGAALMYFLDPVAGRRRRALARDRGVSVGHDAEHFARAKSKRAIDRAHGMVARARAGLSHAPVDDGQLHGRIRTRLGRLVAHPGEVNIEVNGGRVVLRGHATDAEIDQLTAALAAMNGVADVDNRLSVDAPESRH
ncbi:BON domain-containing protein [Novilysobacter erysipheiresistens]|uniref:BON domain-containing protein n=1 Tax=Novilysobacter erysipheiresistens TaxID=1749332 RepID=A0ABU7YVX4_9GAMM